MKYLLLLLIAITSCTAQKDSIVDSSSLKTLDEKPIVTNTPNEKGEIRGSVKDDSGEPLAFATVILLNGQVTVQGVTTDLDGKFKLGNINPGTYDLEVNYVGYSSKKITGVKVNGFQKIDFVMINMPEQEIILLKPVIYLYPEETTKINVTMNYDGELTHTYPDYPVKGWNMKAEPNGTLWDEQGQEYYALFWEGKPTQPIVPIDGFVVAGNETVPFLEEKLAQLGLNRREANEFIMFWMPQMENNNYNFIHFASAEYEAISNLAITPKPETVIRVMMLTQPLTNKIDFPIQDISPLKIERKGFTVVEWGGSILHNKIDL